MEWQLYFLEGMEFLFLGLGSWFDLKNQKIPVIFLVSFGLIAIVGKVYGKYQSIAEIVPGVCIGLLFLWIGWITKEAIGYGDGLGILILALLAGWRGMIPIVCGGFFLSGIYGICRMICSKGCGEETIPFFPFLLLALLGIILL